MDKATSAIDLEMSYEIDEGNDDHQKDKLKHLFPEAEGTKDKRKNTTRKDKHTLSLVVKSVEIEIKKEKKKIKVQLKEIGNNDGTKWLIIIKCIKRIVGGVYNSCHCYNN